MIVVASKFSNNSLSTQYCCTCSTKIELKLESIAFTCTAETLVWTPSRDWYMENIVLFTTTQSGREWSLMVCSHASMSIIIAAIACQTWCVHTQTYGRAGKTQSQWRWRQHFGYHLLPKVTMTQPAWSTVWCHSLDQQRKPCCSKLSNYTEREKVCISQVVV